MTFGEFNDSSVPFSFINPSSDQDMNDVTLGKLLTKAHRGQADYCDPEGVSVSQSVVVVCCVRWIRETWWREKGRSISCFLVVTRNTYSAQSKFSENTQAEKVVDGSGKLDERNSSNAQIRTLLEETETDDYRGISRKKSVITNSMQLMQKKSVESYKDNYGAKNWNFVKFINKILLRWRNNENSKVLPSIRCRDESSSRTRTLFWNYQAEFRNYKMK